LGFEPQDDDTGDINYYSDPSLPGTGETTWERPPTRKIEQENGYNKTTPAI
jgi:hypothetical protein